LVVWDAGVHDIVLTASAEMIPDRLVLTPLGALPLATLSATAPVVQEWEATHRVVSVDAAAAETVLVVHENANSGWTATLDGVPLAAQRVDGWQQGWRLPAAHSGGTVVLEFGPDRTYRWGLAGGLVAALLVVGLAMLPPRRVRARPAPSRRTPRWAADAAAPALGLVLAGLPGLVVGVAVRVLARRTGRAALAFLAGMALLLTGVVAAVRPWPQPNSGAFGLAAQVLAVVAVCALMASGTGRRPRMVEETTPNGSADESAQP
jgi:arabinofuranan 3-O-arabinosyltransferase